MTTITINPAAITFDTTGESTCTLTCGDGHDVFLRFDGKTYTVATVAQGEPTEGNQYLTSRNLADLCDTLSRRGYKVAEEGE